MTDLRTCTIKNHKNKLPNIKLEFTELQEEIAGFLFEKPHPKIEKLLKSKPSKTIRQYLDTYHENPITSIGNSIQIENKILKINKIYQKNYKEIAIHELGHLIYKNHNNCFYNFTGLTPNEQISQKEQNNDPRVGIYLTNAGANLLALAKQDSNKYLEVIEVIEALHEKVLENPLEEFIDIPIKQTQQGKLLYRNQKDYIKICECDYILQEIINNIDKYK